MTKSEKKIKRALSALDHAVQEWYDENNPNDLERYATCHIRTYPGEGHVSNVTVCMNSEKLDYIQIFSNKQTL